MACCLWSDASDPVHLSEGAGMRWVSRPQQQFIGGNNERRIEMLPLVWARQPNL
jgi:hypothetical protein